MTYSCSDFTDSILDALAVVVPDDSADSPSDQADLALAAIDDLKTFRTVAYGKDAAARAMRAALQAMLASYGPPDAVASLCDYPAGHAITLARAAIAQAEAAGIKVQS